MYHWCISNGTHGHTDTNIMLCNFRVQICCNIQTHTRPLVMLSTIGVLKTVTCTSHASLQLPLRYQGCSPSEKIICVCDPNMHENDWQSCARGVRGTWGLSTVCSATQKCQPRSEKREPSQAFERAHTVAHWVMRWKRRCLAVPYCTKKIVRLFMCEHTAFSNTIPKLTQTPS